MRERFRISTISNSIILLAIMVTVTSCFKDDDPIKLPIAKNSIEQITMGPDYNYTVYYDISTQTSYVRDMKSWDLAFSFMDSTCDIHLNGGKGMFVAQTESKNFKANVNIGDLKFNWDAPNGSSDSTGIGDWKSANNLWSIYVVDRGPYYTNDEDRYKKLQIYGADKDYYLIYYSDLKGKDVYYIYIPKYKNKNFSYFTFDDNGHCIDLEPNRDDWDIVFTRNTHTFHESNPPLPYIVTTVLINPYNVSAGEDSTTAFADINTNHAATIPLYKDWDVIGWDWKEFDQTLGLYTVRPYKNYIVKDGEENMYKLHFTDFYDKNRQRGYPKFEFVRLQ